MKKLSDEVKLSLVTAICLLGMAIISKNILNVQMDFISANGPFYVFFIYLLTKNQKSKCNKPLYWNLAIILVTISTIFLYAL